MSPDRFSLTNQFLIAMPGMGDDSFSGAVVYLCEHNENGALGLMINKPIDIKLKNLFQKVELTLDSEALGEQPVFYGGPVQTERGFVLHENVGDQPPYSSTLAIAGGLAMTTSKDVLEALSAGGGPKRLLVTLGYSGWAAGRPDAQQGHVGAPQRLHARAHLGVQRLGVEDQVAHVTPVKVRRNWSRITAAEAASRSCAPPAAASVVL